MSVRSVCNPNVATISANRSVREAARRMRESHVGDLIVTEPNRGGAVPIGVLTDRDIVVGIIAENVSADDLTVGDIMSTDVVTVNEDNGLEFALREMQQKGIRRIPVINSEGLLVGVLSADDVLDYVAGLVAHMAGILRQEQRTETTRHP